MNIKIKVDGKTYKIKLNKKNIGIKNFLYRLKKTNNNYSQLAKEGYFNLRNLGWHILIDSEVNELPVDLFKIAEHYGILVLAYQDYQEFFTKLPNWEIKREVEAFTFELKKMKIIGYNKNYPLVRRRFSVAHELAHCFLEHKLSENPTEEQIIKFENEADLLAARLLMPVGILNELNVKSPSEIAQLCNTSLQASTKRFDRLQMLRERGKFNTSDLEKQVVDNFKTFIETLKGNK